MTSRHARRRPARRILLLAAVTIAATAVVLVLAVLTPARGAPDQDAPDLRVGALPSSTSTSTSTSETRHRRVDHPAVSGRPMGRSAPTRVRIPAIGVNSSLMELGLQSDGSLEVPPDGASAGWFTGAPTPGELGPAIIAGHVRWDGIPGVFELLTDLDVGNMVHVARQDGSTAAFRVTKVEHFAKSAFPTEAVYGNIPRAGLRLITCGGLDPVTNSYEQNVVVFAVLVA